MATLGPASSTPEVLGGMVEAGLDVVRLNFSHGEKADHLARFELVRSVAAERNRNLAILVDLQGPKIRVGMVDDNGVRVDQGREVVLVAGVDRAPSPTSRSSTRPWPPTSAGATRSCWTTAPSACGWPRSRASGCAARWSGGASSSPARA